ncbi:UNVERIFIED_CONTAM: hypothetical protein Sindi_2578100 [Sesamum indicum]
MFIQVGWRDDSRYGTYASPRYGAGEGLFTYGTNRLEGIASFLNAFNFDLAYKRMMSIMSAYDVTRLGVLSNSTITRLFHGKATRVANLFKVIEQLFNHYEELKRLNDYLDNAKKTSSHYQGRRS